ncbi:hypothetical protein, partial [Mesorhizobium sp.]|uniref:hypothetical protein n=1 Tax=Mesorhizobium sp. TaxID=1871066 RepID=UPI00258614AF
HCRHVGTDRIPKLAFEFLIVVGHGLSPVRTPNAACLPWFQALAGNRQNLASHRSGRRDDEHGH